MGLNSSSATYQLSDQGQVTRLLEAYFSYLKIGFVIVFLAHSQQSIKVGYFYCLLGGKQCKNQCKRLPALAPTVCCRSLSAFLCYISWVRESDRQICLSRQINVLVNTRFLFYLTHRQHLARVMKLFFLKYLAQLALRTPSLLGSSRFCVWLFTLSLCLQLSRIWTLKFFRA